MSFCVHLNVRPTCVIVEKISYPYVLHYIINNCASGCIIVFSNFLKPDLISPVTDYPMWVNVTLCIYHTTMSCFINDFKDEICFWVSNDISGLIIDRVNEKFLSNYTPFLYVLYSPISSAVEIKGYVLYRVLYVI